MFIYKIINKLNGKIYVGKKENVLTWKNYYGSGLIIRNAIKKYGKENFEREIIEECSGGHEVLNEREKFWISELNSTYPNGYNITGGGDGGDRFTNNPFKEDVRKKISLAGKGRKHTEQTKRQISKTRIENMSLETIQKIADAKRGTHLSEETKKKLSDIAKKRPIQYELLKRMSLANVGSHRSEECKKKMSDASKLRYQDPQERIKTSNSLKGRKTSNETKMKISMSLKKRHELLKIKEEEINEH